MKNRRKQGKIFRSLLAVLMLTAMLVTSVLQPVFAGDYEAGKSLVFLSLYVIMIMITFIFNVQPNGCFVDRKHFSDGAYVMICLHLYLS